MAVIRNSEFSCFYPTWAGLGAAFRHVAAPAHTSHQHCHLHQHSVHQPPMLSNIFLYVSKYFCMYLIVCILTCKSSVLLITGRGGCRSLGRAVCNPAWRLQHYNISTQQHLQHQYLAKIPDIFTTWMSYIIFWSWNVGQWPSPKRYIHRITKLFRVFMPCRYVSDVDNVKNGD